MSSPNKFIKHVTEIDAPISLVWAALIDVNNWDWNKWTRLEAENVSEGHKGKLMASFEGNNEWETFDFIFGSIGNTNKNETIRCCLSLTSC